MENTGNILQLQSSELKSLTDIVYEKIKSAIINEDLAPGSRISERELTRQTGVSSTTVKRAIQLLQVEGLVEIRPRKGTYVTQSFPSIEENILIRTYLEGLAARFAALKATEADIEEMRQQIDVMREMTNQKILGRLIEANTRFHSLVHEKGRNPNVSRLIEILKSFDWQLREQVLSNHAEAVRSLNEHVLIMEAIAAHDPDLSEELMKKHGLKTLAFVHGSKRALGTETIKKGSSSSSQKKQTNIKVRKS